MSDRASIPNEPPKGVPDRLWADLLAIAHRETDGVHVLYLKPKQARMILASVVKAKVRDVIEEVLGSEEE